MTTVVTGSYRRSLPDQPPAPYVTGDALFGSEHLKVEFLIDTGADITMLSPRDAVELFGSEGHRRLGQLFPASRVSITGVGTAEAIEVPLRLAFRVLGERPVVFRQPVLVTANLPAPRATVPIPSLLGRDSLNRFVLLLNPATETVELTELDAASAG